MDTIALNELFEAGFNVCYRRYQILKGLPPGIVAPRDAETALVLDRLAQAGTVLLRHEISDVWDELLVTLLKIFRLAIPEDPHYENVSFPPRDADFLLAVVERIVFLGAYARRLERFDFARRIVVQLPDMDLPHHYWLRYAVTMVARGEVAAFRGKKSLIPVASEYLRTQPEFFELFGDNMDTVVNSMCQFDFFACVVAVHLSDNLDEFYPNFGLYWNHRTTPVVVDLVSGGRAREALPEIDDDRLASILREIDKVTAKVFFDFAGWSSNQWEDSRITNFLRQHKPISRSR